MTDYKNLNLTDRSPDRDRTSTYGNPLDLLNVDLKGGYSSLWKSKNSLNGESNTPEASMKRAVRRVSQSVDICLNAFGRKEETQSFRFLATKEGASVSYRDLPLNQPLMTGLAVGSWSKSQLDDILYGQALSQVGSRLSTNIRTFCKSSRTSKTAQALYLALEHYKGQEKIAETLPGFVPYLKLFNSYLLDPKQENKLQELQQQLRDVHPEYLEDNKQIYAYAIILNLYSEGQLTSDLPELNKQLIEDKTEELLSPERTKDRLKAIKDFLKEEEKPDNESTIAGIKDLMELLSKERDKEPFEGKHLNRTVEEVRSEAYRYPNESQAGEVDTKLLSSIKELVQESGKQDTKNLKARYSQRKRRLRGRIQRLRDRLLNLNQDQAFPVNDLTSGALDEGGLEKVIQGSDRLFSREEQYGKDYYNIALLIDESGSMDRKHVSDLVDLCTVVYEAIRDLEGVGCSVYGHSSDLKHETEGRVYRYCTPGEDCPWLMELCDSRAQNYDGWAILETAFDLRETVGTGSVLLFILSDGKPEGRGYHGSEAEGHTAEAIDHVRKYLNFKVLGLGIDDAYDQETGNRLFGKRQSLILEGTDGALKAIPKQIYRELAN